MTALTHITNPLTNLFERRLVCNSHAHSHLSYINYHVDIGPTLHCPDCNTTHASATSCEYDYADVLVTRYHHPKFTRKVALWCLNELNRLNLDRSPSHQYQIEDIMTELGITTLALRPKTYLTSHCTSCGGSFTTLYTNAPVQHTPPSFCIWCGSPSISTVQEETEESAFISLATHYNIPLVLFKHLYDIWHNDSKYQYLNDFITNEPTIQPILNKLRTTQK